MRAIILFIACIFVFETVGYSCVSAPVKKSPAKKHDSKKQVSRKSSSKARVLASVSKASSIKKAPTKTKNSKKTQIIPLPRKKHAAMEKNNVRRKITSEKSKPNPSKNTAQRKPKDPLKPMLAYLNEKDPPSDSSLMDSVDEGDVDNQALEETEASGVTTVRRDRAKLTPEDPPLNENH